MLQALRSSLIPWQLLLSKPVVAGRGRRTAVTQGVNDVFWVGWNIQNNRTGLSNWIIVLNYGYDKKKRISAN